MKIQFHNTLAGCIEPFEPIDPPNVYMYNCGPTVYDFAHVGNFRSFMIADVLRRTLELLGFHVHQVMNLTDVGHMTDDQLADGGGEDKMVAAAKRLKQAKKQGVAPVDNPDDPYQVAQYYIDAFIEDARLLGLKVSNEYPQNMPRATQYIDGMQEMIKKLLAAKHAYIASDGAVYYSVESFSQYGQLSGNTIDRLRSGAGGRITDEHQVVKRHPADFLLWKPDATHIMKWDSPWGAGYPNWHLECSVMATTLLGQDVIDIHMGGEDNIFPHHECEIAQTCGATGKELFSRFWIHARHLFINGEKMSKSKGTFYTVRDLAAKGISPVAVRMELVKAPYRMNANLTEQGLVDSARTVQRLRDFSTDLDRRCDGAVASVDLTHPALEAFGSALADDLNIAAAMASLFAWIQQDHSDAAESLAVLRQMDRVLGVLDLGLADNQEAGGDLEIAETCAAIDQARAQKEFEVADNLRQQLVDAGYEVHTSKGGTTARKKLA